MHIVLRLFFYLIQLRELSLTLHTELPYSLLQLHSISLYHSKHGLKLLNQSSVAEHLVRCQQFALILQFLNVTLKVLSLSHVGPWDLFGLWTYLGSVVSFKDSDPFSGSNSSCLSFPWFYPPSLWA